MMLARGLRLFPVFAMAAAAAALQASPAVAASRLYWTDFGNSTISFANLNDTGGGGTLKITGATPNEPWGIAIDPAANRIYWANFGNNTISFASLNGGAGMKLDTAGAKVDEPSGLAVDPATNKIYWANASGNTVYFANLDDTGHGGQLDTDGATVSFPSGLAIDPATNKIYGTSFDTNSVWFADLDNTGHGGQLDTTAAMLNRPRGLAVDPANKQLYIGNCSGSISFVGLAGGAGGPLDLAGATPGCPEGVAVDPSANRIYWGTTGSSVGFANLDNTGGGGQLDTGGATIDSSMFPAILKAPHGTARPAISGNSTPGSVLSCSKGHWAPDLLGSFLYQSPATYRYRWTLNGKLITGADSRKLTAKSAGLYVCRVTAANHAGFSTQKSALHKIS
jgi:hypothetical protein